MARQALSTPEELLHFSLRSTLMTESHSLEAHGDLKDAAKDKK